MQTTKQSECWNAFNQRYDAFTALTRTDRSAMTSDEVETLKHQVETAFQDLRGFDKRPITNPYLRTQLDNKLIHANWYYQHCGMNEKVTIITFGPGCTPCRSGWDAILARRRRAIEE